MRTNRLCFPVEAGGIYALEVALTGAARDYGTVWLTYEHIADPARSLSLLVRRRDDGQVVIRSPSRFPFVLQTNRVVKGGKWERATNYTPVLPSCKEFVFTNSVSPNANRFYRAVFTNEICPP